MVFVKIKTINQIKNHYFKETFKRIAGVFALSDQLKDLDLTGALDQSSLVGTTFAYNVSCPDCDDKRLHDVYFLLAFNYAQLFKTLESNQGLKSTLSNHVCGSYGFNVSKTQYPPRCSGLTMVEFYATLFGTRYVSIVIIKDRYIQSYTVLDFTLLFLCSVKT